MIITLSDIHTFISQIINLNDWPAAIQHHHDNLRWGSTFLLTEIQKGWNIKGRMATIRYTSALLTVPDMTSRTALHLSLELNQTQRHDHTTARPTKRKISGTIGRTLPRWHKDSDDSKSKDQIWHSRTPKHERHYRHWPQRGRLKQPSKPRSTKIYSAIKNASVLSYGKMLISKTHKIWANYLDGKIARTKIWK